MKLSRLEPHIVQDADEHSDIESFLEEVREQQSRVEEISTEVSLPEEGVGSSADEVKQGFVRLVDFLKLKKSPSGPKKSKRDVAMKAYGYSNENPHDQQGMLKKRPA